MGESEPYIDVEHETLKDAEGEPARSRVPLAAFEVAKGFKSRGWNRVPDVDKEKPVDKPPAAAAKEKG